MSSHAQHPGSLALVVEGLLAHDPAELFSCHECGMPSMFNLNTVQINCASGHYDGLGEGIFLNDVARALQIGVERSGHLREHAEALAGALRKQCRLLMERRDAVLAGTRGRRAEVCTMCGCAREPEPGHAIWGGSGKRTNKFKPCSACTGAGSAAPAAAAVAPVIAGGAHTRAPADHGGAHARAPADNGGAPATAGDA